jgi:hypothetical protein
MGQIRQMRGGKGFFVFLQNGGRIGFKGLPIGKSAVRRRCGRIAVRSQADQTKSSQREA